MQPAKSELLKRYSYSRHNKFIFPKTSPIEFYFTAFRCLAADKPRATAIGTLVTGDIRV